MSQAEQSIQQVRGLTELKQVGGCDKKTSPVELMPYFETLLPENLRTHCRECPAGKAIAEV